MRFSTPHGHDLFHHGLFQHSWFAHDIYDDVGVHRGWLAISGILFFLFGIIGFFMAAAMTVASVIFFGALAIAGGIIQLVQSFSYHGQRYVIGGALLGVLYVIAGILIVSNPVAASLSLTLFLAGALIALGAVRIGFWLQHRSHRYWLWSIISGLISIVLGFLIIAQWPVTGLWVIGLFVSLEMIFHGASALGLAMEGTTPTTKRML
ncbi:HdeD family acid-resistance protein [Geomonas sp. Red32]|uniref:HdeD family acid-resistance protein n=1 Tax=Geomonas sp. Red32 TaxID=2912856 RepID=UPI00202CF848|nr:HdeD family acid-resistance protein [Geomonas sp. Red32]MCM0083662.1 HdeD family acid-resistance protein [Geomonas sp. Red32]